MTNHTTRFLSFSELMQKLGRRSRSSIYRDVEKGRLPTPSKIGHNLFWREDEIDEALERQRVGNSIKTQRN